MNGSHCFIYSTGHIIFYSCLKLDGTWSFEVGLKKNNKNTPQTLVVLSARTRSLLRDTPCWCFSGYRHLCVIFAPGYRAMRLLSVALFNVTTNPWICWNCLLQRDQGIDRLRFCLWILASRLCIFSQSAALTAIRFSSFLAVFLNACCTLDCRYIFNLLWDVPKYLFLFI